MRGVQIVWSKKRNDGGGLICFYHVVNLSHMRQINHMIIGCVFFFPIFSSHFSTFLNMGGYEELDRKRGMMGVH